ncbi:MAG: hypothetical protein JST01_03515 [Cyanobacteria bacterium SZAS TMP-1]|nr:hypothetical protein [Cyanobacteria bacterium SZAS TMP-1]
MAVDVNRVSPGISKLGRATVATAMAALAGLPVMAQPIDVSNVKTGETPAATTPSPTPAAAPGSAVKQGSVTISRGATPIEMVAILRNAKVVNPAYPLRASFNEHEAIVTTQRNPKATDKDCKIDAVLMAKALIDTFQGEVLRVKVLFSDYEKQTCSTIKVTKGDVESYGSGSIDQGEFLESLEINTFKENDSPFGSQAGQSLSVGVAPGFMHDKRLVLLSRIEALEQKGTNTKAFIQCFQQIEDLVKQGDEKQVVTMVQTLSRSLDDQEALRQQVNSAGLRQEILQLQTSLQSKIAIYAATGKKLPIGMNDLVQVQQLTIAGRFAEAKKLLQVLQQKLR